MNNKRRGAWLHLLDDAFVLNTLLEFMAYTTNRFQLLTLRHLDSSPTWQSRRSKLI